MNLIKVINPECGWDNLVCLADSEEAAAFKLRYKSVEDLYNQQDFHIEDVSLTTLPDGLSFEKAKAKYWSD